MASRVAMALFALVVVATATMLLPAASTAPGKPAKALHAVSAVDSQSPAASVHQAARSAIVRSTQRFRAVAASDVVEVGGSARTTMPFLGRYGLARPGSAPSLSATSPHAASAATRPKISLYNGLDRAGLAASINGTQQVAPPDSTGAIGPVNYVELVNSAIAVYRRNLTAVTHTSLRAWVHGSVGVSYCDPQIQWDPAAGRWFYVFLFCNASLGGEDLHFGWSKTADPTNVATGWCNFIVTTGNDLLDYPKLGHNSKFLIIGANGFDDQTTNLVGGAVLWMLKPARRVSTCTVPPSVGSAFPLTNGDGVTVTMTPVPVNTMTGAADGYVVSAYDPTNAPQTKLAVWHLNTSGTLIQDPDLTVASFTAPVFAPQPGTSDLLDTLDGRLTQAVGDPTTGIWTQHTVGGPGGRSIVQWYEIKVTGGVASLTQQGDISSATDFVFNGAISPRFDAGGAAIFYNRSSLTLAPVIDGQIRVTATAPGAMEPGEIILGTSPAADTDGSCNFPSPGSPCRWGDYSGATPDPVATSVVWGTNEINTESTGGSPAAWADYNFAVLFTTAPHAPTAVLATAGKNAATVSWTPSTFVPSTPVTSYTITEYVGATPGLTVVVLAPATSGYFPGLTEGVTYTFTVFATNGVGSSPESVHSASVIISRQAAQSTPAPPTDRPPVNPATPQPPGPRG